MASRVLLQLSANAASRRPIVQLASRYQHTSAPLVPSMVVLEEPGKTGSRPRWTASEDQKLWAAISEQISGRSKTIDWDVVSQSLSVKRVPSALRARYKNALRNTCVNRRFGPSFPGSESEAGSHLLSQPRVGLKWTPKEDDALRTGVDIYGSAKWKLVAGFVGTRGTLQCASRWRSLSSPLSGEASPRMHWARTIQRNNKLKALADGKNSSSPEISRRSAVVAAILQQQQEPPGTCQTPDASAASVDVPWSDSQDARLDRAEGRPLLVPFSAEEDQMIMRLTRQYGRKWTLIARLITASHQQKLVDGGDGSTSQAAIIRTGLNVQTRHSIIGKRHGKAASKGTAEAERGDPERIGAAQKQAKPARRVNQIWTPEEDAALVRIVEAMMEEEAGFSSWNEVARQMPTDRTNRQCRTRWMLNVGTHLQHTAFTEAEDKLLWPFVVDSEQRPLRTRGRKEFSGKPIAINYAQGDDEAPAFVGIGWFGARRMTGRSSGSLKCRICRLQHIIEWLGKVAGVKDAHLQFDLVHRLANTPSDFRIISRNINKAEAVKEKI